MEIKVYTRHSEKTNTRYYRRFKIVDELPKLNEKLIHGSSDSYYQVTAIYGIIPDCENDDKVWDYDYYEVILDYVEEERGKEVERIEVADTKYIAVRKE